MENMCSNFSNNHLEAVFFVFNIDELIINKYR